MSLVVVEMTDQRGVGFNSRPALSWASLGAIAGGTQSFAPCPPIQRRCGRCFLAAGEIRAPPPCRSAAERAEIDGSKSGRPNVIVIVFRVRLGNRTGPGRRGEQGVGMRGSGGPGQESWWRLGLMRADVPISRSAAGLSKHVMQVWSSPDDAEGPRRKKCPP